MKKKLRPTAAMTYIAKDLCELGSAYKHLYYAVIYWKSSFQKTYIESRSIASVDFSEVSSWVDNMEHLYRMHDLPFVIYVEDMMYADNRVLELYE